MAVLTQTGRTALARAIKDQTLHLAWGSGSADWATSKTFAGAFAPENTLALPFTHVSAVVVKSADNATTYSAGVDYTVTAATGTINRIVDGAIPAEAVVNVSYAVDTPPEDGAATALLNEVGRRIVDECLYVTPAAEGAIVVPTGRFDVSATPTNHLLVRVRFDFGDAPASTIREQALFVGSVTDPALPVGQKYFTPAQVVDPGILLVLQHSVAIIRQPSTRETFEFVVTF